MQETNQTPAEQLKTRSTFSIVTTILVTSALTSGAVFGPLSLVSIFLPHFGVPQLLIVAYSLFARILGVAFGVALGAAYVVTSTTLSSKQQSRVPTWTAFVSLGVGFFDVMSSVLSGVETRVDWQFLLDVLVITTTVYAISRFVIQHTELVRQQWQFKTIKRLQVLAVAIELFIYFSIVVGVYNVATTDQWGVSQLLPMTLQTQVRGAREQYQQYQKQVQENVDQQYMNAGSAMVSDLQLQKSYLGRYPATYDIAGFSGWQLLNIGTNKLDTNRFTYDGSAEGDHYKLCVVLSRGNYCWSDLTNAASQ
jgi:hypothetical protein